MHLPGTALCLHSPCRSLGCLLQMAIVQKLLTEGDAGVLPTSKSCCCCTGANDYFSIVFQNTSVTAEAVTGYIEDAMLTLYTKGARK